MVDPAVLEVVPPAVEVAELPDVVPPDGRVIDVGLVKRWASVGPSTTTTSAPLTLATGRDEGRGWT
ncbi:MAG: hypothetical protein ACRD0J_02665, partial [Acidimicrobiales bacterium]